MYKSKLIRRILCAAFALSLLLSFSLNAFASAGTVYESENNNSYLRATRTYNDYDSYGLMNNTTDVDYWVVSFPYGGLANFYLGNIPSGKNYDMYIYSSNGTSLLRSSTNSGNNYELVTLNVSAYTNYYIKIVSASGMSTTSYYLFRTKVYPSKTLQVPRYVQLTDVTCGPACGRMILGYYGINVAEYDFQEMSTSLAKNYEDYTYASVIARTLNYYLGANGNSVRYQDKYFSSYSEQGFTDYVLQNIMNDRPVQIPVVINSTTYFPYTSGGHYVVIKGMQYSSSSEAYNSIINDPHYQYSNVYTVPINVIRSYNLAHSGCMICPTE